MTISSIAFTSFRTINFIASMNNSQAEAQSHLGKTTFQTLFKDRANKSLSKQKRQLSLKLGQHSSLKKIQTKLDKISSNQAKAPQNIEDGPVKTALNKLNFDHHNPEECLCGSCECGRHLCKFKIIKPDLVKRTSYEHQFPMKIALQSEVLIRRQTKPLHGDHIDLKTNYKHSFKDSHLEKVEKPRPLDNLKEVGPIQSFTTYQNAFKDFQVPNQYVKHTDRCVRANFPFRSKSLYSKQFINKDIKRRQSLKSIDQISLGKLWMGDSTYNRTFQKPKRDLLDPIVKNIEKMNKTLQDKLRHRTTYKSDFTLKAASICPSKKLLGENINLSELKHKLSENADYKSMSPHFHAISTSKHFYV